MLLVGGGLGLSLIRLNEKRRADAVVDAWPKCFSAIPRFWSLICFFPRVEEPTPQPPPPTCPR